MAFFSFQLHPRPGSVYVRNPHQPRPVMGCGQIWKTRGKNPFRGSRRQPARTTSGQCSHAVATPTPRELRPRQEHNAAQSSQPLGGRYIAGRASLWDCPWHFHGYSLSPFLSELLSPNLLAIINCAKKIVSGAGGMKNW